MKKALITGITGQDWAYLAEFLLDKGYEVHWIKRRSSLFNTDRIDHLYQDPHNSDRRLFLHYWDMTDSANLIKLVSEIAPNEIYNLAAQSHVAVSFQMPEYTANTDALGTLRLLEAIKIAGLEKVCKFYQASTSELFWWLEYNRPELGYNEDSPMHPRSPYWVAKLYWLRITKNYREAYWMFACNGILFNHESPLRWETFVTRKITRWVAQIYLWLTSRLYIGNLDAKRDRGHAKDYVKWMWLMLQQENPDDYVLATGEAYSVRDFIEYSFSEVGITIRWIGKGVEEKWYNAETGECLVEVDPQYFRPAEVDFLLWDPSKAKGKLWWSSEYTLEKMCREMVKADIELFKQQKILKEQWFTILSQYE